jgi:hypothetical protein
MDFEDSLIEIDEDHANTLHAGASGAKRIISRKSLVAAPARICDTLRDTRSASQSGPARR